MSASHSPETIDVQLPSEPMASQSPSSPPTAVRQLDFRLLDYVSEVDTNITCPICHCPFINGVRIDCDHTFCKDCLQGALAAQSSSRKTCPSCRTRIADSNITSVPRFIRQMVDDLVVHCPNKSAGCTDQLRREDLQHHVDRYCHFADVQCPASECDLLILRHMATSDECMHQIVRCDDCEAEMMAKDFQDHHDKKCPVRNITCEYCSASHPASRADDHFDTCPEVVLPCPAAAIGCKTKHPRKDVGQHADNCPLVALQPTLAAMSTKIRDQQSVMASLKRKNDIQEAIIASLQGSQSNRLSSDALAASSNTREPLSNSSRNPLDILNETSQGSNSLDNTTQHLLSSHESLRYDVENIANIVGDLEGRFNMTILNDQLHMRNELAGINAAMASLSAHLHFLSQTRHAAVNNGPGMSHNGMVPKIGGLPVRRLSDPSRQDTKL